MQPAFAMFRWGVWALLCLVFAVAACGEGGSMEHDSRLGQLDGPGYRIEVLGSQHMAVGDDVRVDVRLMPMDDAHLSADYPAQFAVQSSTSVRVSPATVQRADGVATRGEDLQVFAVTVHADRAGAAELEAQIRFGLCEGDQCRQITETLGFELIAYD